METTLIAKSAKREFCFGAIGRQCAVPGSQKSKTLSPLNMVTCSKVEKGQTNCWVSPGSIIHDNCCTKHPKGMMCSSETQMDGFCAKEWETAYQDISKKQAWYHIYKLNEAANLSMTPSKRMKNFGGEESQSTAALCAPPKTKLLAKHDPGFCCSGKAKKQGGYLICLESSKNSEMKNSNELQKKILALGKNIEELLKALKGAQKNKDLAKAEEIGKKVENYKQEKQKYEQQLKVSERKVATLPPPPLLPPLPQQYRKPATKAPASPSQMVSKPLPQKQESKPFDFEQKREEPSQPKIEQQEEEIAIRPQQDPMEPQPEAVPQCDRGTWSPTFGRCIEEEVQEQAAVPDCPGGTHWSPTLQSCQSD